MDIEGVKPYTIEDSSRTSEKNPASYASVIYFAFSILVPLFVTVVAGLFVTGTATLEAARLAIGVVSGICLVVLGITLIRSGRSARQNIVFSIIGLVFSGLYTVLFVFLGLIVLSALIAIRLQ